MTSKIDSKTNNLNWSLSAAAAAPAQATATATAAVATAALSATAAVSDKDQKVGEKPTKPLALAKAGKGNGLHEALTKERVGVHPSEELETVKNEVETLLGDNVNPQETNKNGDTALHLVARLRYWGPVHDALVLALLKAGAKANVPNLKGETALHVLVSAGASKKTIQALLTTGQAAVNARNSKGDTALHCVAAIEGHSAIYFDPEVAKTLLENGAQIELANAAGDTALHAAISSRKEENITFFATAAKGVINAPNKEGNTALHLLAGFNQYDIWGIESLVSLLIAQGASKTVANLAGKLPYHRAYERGGPSTALGLLQADVDVNTTDAAGQNALHKSAKDTGCKKAGFEEVLKKIKDPSLQDKDGNTALHFASQAGFYEAVEMLVACKVAVDTPNLVKETPLYLAVWGLMLASYREITSHAAVAEMRLIREVLDSTAANPKRFVVKPQFATLHSEALRLTINLLLDKGANGSAASSFCNKWLQDHATFKY